MNFQCLQISHLAGLATTSVPGEDLGAVTEGTLPAREAFETAGASSLLRSESTQNK